MAMSRGAVAALAVLLGASLHGCNLDTLPEAVQVAIGHSCVDKSEDVTKDIAAAEKELGEKHPCEDLNQDMLSHFEVDCEKTAAKIVSWTAEFECAEMVADTVAEKCEEVTEDCHSAVDDGVAAWALQKPEVDKDKEEEEKKEGFEVLLALINQCHASAKDNYAHGDLMEAACSADKSQADLETMGIEPGDCTKYVNKVLVDISTFTCTGFVLENPPDLEEGTAPTLDDVKEAVKHFYEQDAAAVEGKAGNGDRLRLYAQAAIKSKSWPKPQTWSTKMAKLGGASVAALAVLAIVGMRRRSAQRVEAQDEQQLMDIE